ncbi:MAG: type II toxin-antitoxin system RelE/ParE family toxin [Methanoculleus sp.]|jgi:mRNA interferase RelE/StbE|nr:type II toxin-antitoxin system RelE/ParE family toxin [Methanoculleus sp.]
MTCTVIYTARARWDLRKLPAEAARRIIRSVAGIRENPYRHVRKLAGFSRTPVYRLREGWYRVILTIEDERLLILVLEAGHRSSIYR